MVLVYDTTLRERIASISFEEERCVDEEYWVVGGGGRGGGGREEVRDERARGAERKVRPNRDTVWGSRLGHVLVNGELLGTASCVP